MACLLCWVSLSLSPRRTRLSLLRSFPRDPPPEINRREVTTPTAGDLHQERGGENRLDITIYGQIRGDQTAVQDDATMLFGSRIEGYTSIYGNNGVDNRMMPPCNATLAPWRMALDTNTRYRYTHHRGVLIIAHTSIYGNNHSSHGIDTPNHRGEQASEGRGVRH